MLAAVLNATNVKIVFRVKDPKEAEQLAEMTMPLNLESPVRALVKPTVVGYRRIRLSNESMSRQRSTTRSDSETWGESEAHAVSVGGSWTDTESESFGTSRSVSEGDGKTTSRSSSAGSADGWSRSEDLDTDGGVFGPGVIGVSRGRNGGRNATESTGSSSNRSRGTTDTDSSSFSRTTAESANWSETLTCGTNHARTAGISEAEGDSRSEGSSEALEAVLADLPSAVHSRDNVRCMAGQLVRSLPTGRALVNYVGTRGMVAALLKVPLIATERLSEASFCQLREEALSRSPCAIPAAQAVELVAERERTLIGLQGGADILEPSSFRTNAPPLAP